MAPQQVRKLAFFQPLARTKTASDWSIYSRDFTRVHPENEGSLQLEKAILRFLAQTVGDSKVRDAKDHGKKF